MILVKKETDHYLVCSEKCFKRLLSRVCRKVKKMEQLIVLCGKCEKPFELQKEPLKGRRERGKTVELFFFCSEECKYLFEKEEIGQARD